ncbi:hypothetical protein [Prosthecobacter sp.]|uniref:hypothetical protein n=1 Tax=Prosthecobacter sp. TaxID=1965333 RepID=UPI003784B789
MMETESPALAHRTDLIDLASFDGRRTAELCSDYLEKCGLETAIFDEGSLQTFVFFTKPAANVKVQVQEKDYDQAVTRLIEFEKEHPKLVPFIYSCPECGSFAVEYPQFSRKFFSFLLIEWMSSLGAFPKRCYCRKCHSTWPRGHRTEINPLHLERHPDMFVPPPA